MQSSSLNTKFFQRLLQLGVLFISLAGIAAHLSCTNTRASHSIREIQLSYAFTVTGIPPNAKHVEIWAPVPQSDQWQQIANLQVECDYPYSFESEPEYDNSILRVATNGSIPESLSVSMNFTVTRTAYHILEESDQATATISEKSRQRFLAADALVPIDGKIAEEANRVVNDDMSPLEKARAIYDHVTGTVTYGKDGIGWGRGDAVYACDVRTGNCTDFHSLFIGMARASGIP
ncbi:MAG: transglutaminase domain-containing protein, partial [bacterium]|nr:transglutaminase domain-containing protein [bacterium]